MTPISINREIKKSRLFLAVVFAAIFVVYAATGIKSAGAADIVYQPGFLSLQELADRYGGYYYVNDLYPAVTVTIGKQNWSFTGNEDGTVTLVRGTVKYGVFDKNDAWVSVDGKIIMKDVLFGRYFGLNNASTHGYEKSIIKNMARLIGNKWLYSNAKDMAERLKFTYGNLSETSVPDAEAVLADELETSVKAQKVNFYWPLSHYNVNEIIEKIISYDGELLTQSRSLGVPKELICSVIFREMVCFDIFDQLFDYRYRATKGLSQISLDGAEFNEKAGKSVNEFQYTRKQLDAMLSVEKEHIYLAAIALKARANLENIFPGTTDQFDIERIFTRYNDTPKAWNSVGSELYGSQTYEYYLAFKKYFEVVDNNRITLRN